MAHHRHGVTMSASPRAQHTETILSVVVGYPLDETCQHFPGLRLRTQVIAFQASPKFVGDFHLEGGGWFFSLPQRPHACDQATTGDKNSRKHLVFDPLPS
jgi:hypothetical protein